MSSWTPQTTRSCGACGSRFIIGGVLTLGALIAGFFIFPRGTKVESDEEVEATHLEVERPSDR